MFTGKLPHLTINLPFILKTQNHLGISTTDPMLAVHIYNAPSFLEKKGQHSALPYFCTSLKDDNSSDVTDMSGFVCSAPHTPHPPDPSHPNGCKGGSVESSIFSRPAILIKVEHYFSMQQKHRGKRFKMLLFIQCKHCKRPI